MHKTRKHTHLNINRQTLRTLASHQLERVSGALRPDGSDRDWSCNICEPSAPTMCATTGP